MCTSLAVVNNISAFIEDISGYVEVAKPVFAPLIKTVAVSVVSKISADVCRDAGSLSLASCVEFAGCVIAVALSLPLVMSVMELVTSI